jgi:chromosome segregation ATPase
MSELNKKYLDLGGLKKYDELIKSFINSKNTALSDAIAALDAKIGTLDIEGSDDKSLSEIVSEIYSSIADIIVSQDTLKNTLEAKDAELVSKDEELAALIQGIRDDLDWATGSNSDNEATIGELNNKVAALTELVSKNTEDIAAATQAAADAQAAAAQSLTDAKAYVDGKVDGKFDVAGTAAGYNTAMSERVSAVESDVAELKAIDYTELATQAAADAVAAVVAEADSDFDTLKEVADWILSDTTGAAGIQIKVAEHTESITTLTGDLDTLEEKVEQDITNLTTHMSEAATALAEVDGRLDVLEALEGHTAIEVSEIEGLFNTEA